MAESTNAIVATLSSALAGGRKDSVDRALVSAASVGASVALLRVAVNFYRTYKGPPTVIIEEVDIDSPVDDDDILSVNLDRSWLAAVRRLLRTVLLLDNPRPANLDGRLLMESGPVIVHPGSCHCRSVHFQILAPRHLEAKDGPGKISYRHTQVRAECFRVVRGKEFVQSYYVASDELTTNQNLKGAHAFCSRCGVHVLYAPSKNAAFVEVNVNCLDDRIGKIHVTTRTDCISEGVPTEGQWEEEEDQLSTINEYRMLAKGFENKLQRVYDDTRSTHAMFNAEKPRLSSVSVPATPTTVGSTSDSFVSSLGLARTAEQDSLETGSHYSSMSRVAKSLPGGVVGEHRTTSPQSRDQMMRYMKKHLSAPTSMKDSRPRGNRFSSSFDK